MVFNIFHKASLLLSQVVLFFRKTNSEPLVTKMTEEEVIKLAHDVALSEDWVWLGIIKAKLIAKGSTWRAINEVQQIQIKKGEKVPIYWRVLSNAGGKGCNVMVYIDDATGNILSKGFAPR